MATAHIVIYLMFPGQIDAIEAIDTIDTIDIIEAWNGL